MAITDYTISEAESVFSEFSDNGLLQYSQFEPVAILHLKARIQQALEQRDVPRVKIRMMSISKPNLGDFSVTKLPEIKEISNQQITIPHLNIRISLDELTSGKINVDSFIEYYWILVIKCAIDSQELRLNSALRTNMVIPDTPEQQAWKYTAGRHCMECLTK